VLTLEVGVDQARVRRLHCKHLVANKEGLVFDAAGYGLLSFVLARSKRIENVDMKVITESSLLLLLLPCSPLVCKAP
jgi:hypothetical protein